MAREELEVVPVAKRDRHGEVVSAPVSAEVKAEIDDWARAHGDDLDKRLERFGLGQFDIVGVDWRRVIRAEEQL